MCRNSNTHAGGQGGDHFSILFHVLQRFKLLLVRESKFITKNSNVDKCTIQGINLEEKFLPLLMDPDTDT